MICLLFTISLAEIFKFPIELISPLFSILFFIFKLLVFSSPNNSSPSFFRCSASIVKLLTAPIELSVLLKIFLAFISIFLLLIFLLLTKSLLKLSFIFPLLSSISLFSKDLALIFKLSFARYFPSKFKVSVVEISIFLVA